MWEGARLMGPGGGGLFPHTHEWLLQHARECLRKHVPKIVRAFLVASSEMESSKIAYVMVLALRILWLPQGSHGDLPHPLLLMHRYLQQHASAGTGMHNISTCQVRASPDCPVCLTYR